MKTLIRNVNWPSFVARHGFHLWIRIAFGHVVGQAGSCGDSQTTQADVMAEHHSTKIDSKVPLLKTKSTEFSESREVEMVPACSFYLYIIVTLVRKGTPKTIKRETLTYNRLQNLPPNICLACKMFWGNGGAELE